MTVSNDNKTPSPRCILNIPFGEITKAPISFTDATQRRFRFLDGESFAQRECLRVFEYEWLPQGEYATLSYVWRGLDPVPNIDDWEGRYLVVEGATDADPISVEVLRLAAVAALFHGCKLVWLDVLCILQADPVDRAWQIQNMYDMYRFCGHCVAIPGGLMRLAAINEETNWVHRAWTLQEAVAPPAVWFLFSWTKGTTRYQSNFTLEFTEIEPGVAAISDMTWLLPMAIKHGGGTDEDAIIHPRAGGVPRIRIMGNVDRYSSLLVALMTAVDIKTHDRRGIAHAVWRSSFMRTARYPVDMVFSIMGIFGVTLDTAKFSHDDRLGATIALMQALMEKDDGKVGGRAEWLGIAPSVMPNAAISTLPMFPSTSWRGRAVIETAEKGEEEASGEISAWWQMENTPPGRVDDEGCLIFKRKSARIVQVSDDDQNGSGVEEDAEAKKNKIFEAVNGSKWRVSSDDSSTPGYRAVHGGHREISRNGAFPLMVDPKNYMVLLVKEHKDGASHTVGYAFVAPSLLETSEWSEKEMRIGRVVEEN